MHTNHISTETPLILTLDIGTSSTRAALYNRHAQVIEGCLAQRTYQMQTTSNGGAVFDPDELFNNVVEVIDQILHLAGPLTNQIGAVAFDTLVTNIMGVNKAGQPVTPVFTYADTRNAVDAQHFRDEFGEDEIAKIHNRTGCLVHSAYLPARFRWLARTRPDLMETAAHWASIGEYLFRRLFGRWQVSYSVAAWTGLLNRHNLAWDQVWLTHLSIDESLLSPLGDVNQPLTGLQSEWAQRWPALKEVPWYPAIGDGAAANIGSGCGNPARIALTIGTSGAMRVVLPPDLDTVPAGLWLYRVDKRRALLGGATTEGGNLFAWLKNTLQLPSSQAEVERELANMPPTGHGLSILPFIAGERAPGWRDDARASLIGFNLNTRPIDILRAGLESVAYRFALIYGLIAPHLPVDNHQIIASGGGVLNSPAWLQIMTDVLGQPVITLAEKEATSRGVALLALESLDIIEDTTTLSPATGKTYEPNIAHHEQYQRAVKKQVDYYNRVVGMA